MSRKLTIAVDRNEDKEQGYQIACVCTIHLTDCSFLPQTIDITDDSSLPIISINGINLNDIDEIEVIDNKTLINTVNKIPGSIFLNYSK